MVSLGAKGIENEDDIQGNMRPLPGQYHVIVNDVTEKSAAETGQQSDKVIVEFQVLNGTTPGQEDRVIPEYFAVSEKAKSRLQRLAVVLGLLKPGEPEKDVDFAEAISKDLVIEVEDNKYEKDGKEIAGVRVSYMGFWSVGNEAVADVPKAKDLPKPSQQPVAVGAGDANDEFAGL